MISIITKVDKARYWIKTGVKQKMKQNNNLNVIFNNNKII